MLSKKNSEHCLQTKGTKSTGALRQGQEKHEPVKQSAHMFALDMTMEEKAAEERDQVDILRGLP